MALLIDAGVKGWLSDQELFDIFSPLLPETKIHLGTPKDIMPDVVMLAGAAFKHQTWENLPNLKLVQKLGAGVEQIVSSPDIPDTVKIARLAPELQATEIAEYCLAYVFYFQRNMGQHFKDSSAALWNPTAPLRSDQTTIGVIGLGHIGSKIATHFEKLGFHVSGWSRSAKNIENVACYSGSNGLDKVLGMSDYVISILPSTPATNDLFNSETFSKMKSNATLINVGRGSAVDETDLITALDTGKIKAAVLDVFKKEPLPESSPLWQHPKIILTPHVSGWHVDGGYEDAAENYRRIIAGQSILNEVDRKKGY